MARGGLRGSTKDLAGFVVGAEDLARAAEELATERSAPRDAARARLDAAAARAAHDLETATSQLEHLLSSRRTLLDGAQWALDTLQELPAYVDAIDAARVALEARQVDQRAARAGLERVLEQRAAASAAIQAADGQLGELDGLGMDENGLRRELEAAGQAVRAAHDAHAASVAAVQELAAEHALVDQRLAQLHEALAAHHPSALHADADYDRVVAAFAEWNRAAGAGGVDAYAQALADAFTDLLADLAGLEGGAGAPVDEHALALAQEQVDQAAKELQRLDAETPAPVLTPSDRADLDAAHAAVDAAAARCDRPLGKAAALRRLDQARAAERSLLERFGFGSYLDVVLTGGRTPTAIPERLAAERAFLAAQARRDSLLRTQPASPELEYLHSERARLLAHVVHHIGVDPGERVIELLRAHPVVPGAAVDGLRNALASVGLVPVGRGLAEVADEWLRHQATVADDHRRARATVEEIEVELADLAGRRDRLAAALSDARLAEAGAAEQLDLASRSVGAVEAELSVRAGEDSSRLQRFVAADQLRTQVEALGATLARAERDATAELDRATEAAGTAEVAFDRAQGAQGDLARRARQLAEELPIDRRPAGDRLATMEALAELLRDHAEVLQPAIDAAEVAVAAATAKVDGAFAEAEAAGTGAGGPRSDDVVDGFVSVLEKGVDEVIVLDEPFAGLDDALRPRLLELVLEHSGQLLLLTEDPELLGWAIGLPAAQATVAAADSVLNLWPRRADTKVTVPTPSARLPAGRH